MAMNNPRSWPARKHLIRVPLAARRTLASAAGGLAAVYGSLWLLLAGWRSLKRRGLRRLLQEVVPALRKAGPPQPHGSHARRSCCNVPVKLKAPSLLTLSHNTHETHDEDEEHEGASCCLTLGSAATASCTCLPLPPHTHTHAHANAQPTCAEPPRLAVGRPLLARLWVPARHGLRGRRVRA